MLQEYLGLSYVCCKLRPAVYTKRMLIAIKRVLYICHLVYVVFFALHGVRSGMEHLQPPEALILSAETEDVLGAVQSGKCLDKKKIQVLLHWRGKKCVDVY